MSYDYIVVGAGSAGSVVAARLSADRRCRVLLLEAGRRSKDLRIRTPGLVATLWRTKFDWGFHTEPQKHMDRRRNYWPRGKVLGGTSCLNYMIYMRGHRADYDGWRDLGNEGWGYDDVLPFFKRSEHNTRGADPHHGAHGLLGVSDVSESEICRLLTVAGAEACGVPLIDDMNAPEREGFGPFQLTVRDGRRSDTGTAFLDPAQNRHNLTVVTEALVESITFKGTRATGVRYRHNGATVTATAGTEVVLSAGAIGSPHLLLRSGVGPADELQTAGVSAHHDLPGVGKNLQDHLLAPVGYEVLTDAAGNVSPLNMLGWLGRYLLKRQGPLVSSGAEAGGFVRTHDAATIPDLQFHFLGTIPPIEPLDDVNYEPKGRGCSIVPTLIYPESVGELTLRSADPEAAPLIDPHYFEQEADVETLLRGVRMAHRIADHDSVRDLLGRPLTPASHRDATDEEIRADLRARATTIFHPVGTCKMGSDPSAVVDAELRVRGLEGLRVADASIMPKIVGGNTNAPTIMIGEKCATFLGAPDP